MHRWFFVAACLAHVAGAILFIHTHESMLATLNVVAAGGWAFLVLKLR